MSITPKNTITEKGFTRLIYRTISTGGSYGSSPLQAHIGVGKSQQIKSIEITWPNKSQTISKFYNVPINKKIVVVENQTEYKVLNIPSQI